MRRVMFTDKDGNVIRTELFFEGNFFTPPEIVLFRKKLYHNSGSSLDTNFYREIKDSFVIVEEN